MSLAVVDDHRADDVSSSKPRRSLHLTAHECTHKLLWSQGLLFGPPYVELFFFKRQANA